MSQAKRSKVLAQVRWREQAAKLVAESMPLEICEMTNREWIARIVGWTDKRHRHRDTAVAEARRVAAGMVLDGHQYFDVVQAREYAKSNPLARRLLDTLDGRCPWAPGAKAQPSECTTCGGGGGWVDLNSPREIECYQCQGTGHNLSGILPSIEWSSAIIRKVSDSLFYDKDGGRSWTADIDEQGITITLSPSMFRPSRVMPRGQF